MIIWTIPTHRHSGPGLSTVLVRIQPQYQDPPSLSYCHVAMLPCCCHANTLPRCRGSGSKEAGRRSGREVRANTEHTMNDRPQLQPGRPDSYSISCLGFCGQTGGLSADTALTARPPSFTACGFPFGTSSSSSLCAPRDPCSALVIPTITRPGPSLSRLP